MTLPLRVIARLLCVAILCLGSSSALAQAAKPAVSQDAQALFEQAVAAYEAGRYRDAVDLFKEADKLAPSALLSFNVAKAYERMSDSKNALAGYRDYLRRMPQAENRLETSQRIAELELALQKQGLQQLTVLSTPAGAALSIDDVARGVTPWTGELTPGPHRVALRLPDYRDAVKEVELGARNSMDVSFELQALAPLDPVLPPEDPIPAPAPAPEPEVSALPSWWTWALFGGSAALLAGAGGFELARRAAEDDYAKNEVQIPRKQHWDTMEARQTTARVLLGAGLAFGVLGGVSLYLDLDRKGAAPSQVGLGCEGGDCRLLARGRW